MTKSSCTQKVTVFLFLIIFVSSFSPSSSAPSRKVVSGYVHVKVTNNTPRGVHPPTAIVVLLKDAEDTDKIREKTIIWDSADCRDNKCYYEIKFSSTSTDYQLGVKLGNARHEAWLTQHIEFGSDPTITQNVEYDYATLKSL
ncbi:hypothetical protein DdX_14369 [Ditylenchus destructor]|uniref:Uncharacterized protein n=1 Tax=Ditylenchus destructor TaxID=166010 RepID=A0AAD4R1Z1_9BILA|nr:hypothetical protein DdX_14369 [Ditylenchus destructor]